MVTYMTTRVAGRVTATFTTPQGGSTLVGVNIHVTLYAPLILLTGRYRGREWGREREIERERERE